MEEQEIWKPVIGYEGIYEISNLGRIRSVDRIITDINGIERRYKGVILSPCDSSNGYNVVYLRNNNIRSRKYVHRLVAEAFIDNPNNFNYINHIDLNKKNNRYDNLEWCTQKYNVNYSLERMCKQRRKYRKSNTGEKYITFKNGLYQVCIVRKDQCKIYKYFKTLEQAITYRNYILETLGEVVI